MLYLLKDFEIREALIKKLQKQNASHNHRIVSELAICDGNARADVVVANGKLCGYEIKSDVDSLNRLNSQMNAYNSTFDRNYLVVGEKYIYIAEKVIPPWWGIYLASRNKKGHITLTQKRNAYANKFVKSESLLELLWKDELVTLLSKHGFKGISKKNKRALRKLITDNLPLKLIKEFTIETIKRRENWREEVPSQVNNC